MKKYWLPTLLLIFLFTACSTRLPAQRPDDFQINYNASAGMLPYGYNIYFAGDTVHSAFFSYGMTFDVAFQPQPAELDTLYRTLVENRFDRIQTYEEEVYDRGGSSITMTANGESFNKADGGMSYIKDAWQDSYNNVEGAIFEIVNRTAPSSTEFTVEWDENLESFSPTVQLVMGGDFLSLSAPKMDHVDHFAVITTSNPLATYEVKVETLQPAMSASFPLDLTKSQYVRISLQGDQIVFSIQK